MKYRCATINDAAAIASVETITWDAAYRGLIPDSVIDHRTLEHRTNFWTALLKEDSGNKVEVLVAENTQGKIVAFCDGGQPDQPYEGYDVEVIGLYVLPEFQRQGCGSELFGRVAQSLAKNNGRALMVWVLRDSKYRRFYEKLGGRHLGERLIQFGGETLVVSGYGWPDINAIGRRH